jgi:hypothetical protein
MQREAGGQGVVTRQGLLCEHDAQCGRGECEGQMWRWPFCILMIRAALQTAWHCPRHLIGIGSVLFCCGGTKRVNGEALHVLCGECDREKGCKRPRDSGCRFELERAGFATG